MNKNYLLILLFFCGMALNAQTTQKKQTTQDSKKSAQKEEVKRLQIGEMLPMQDVKMMDISGQEISLSEIMGPNGIILNFSCNTCPFVIKWEDRYPGIEKFAKDSGIGNVLINSNEARRQGDNMDDSMEAMQAHAKEANYSSYYLLDKNHMLADAIGAFTTPHVFLFNGKGELVYKGAIDDNYKDMGAVKEKYLENAVKAMLMGQTPDPQETKGNGCSIKRLK